MRILIVFNVVLCIIYLIQQSVLLKVSFGMALLKLMEMLKIAKNIKQMLILVKDVRELIV